MAGKKKSYQISEELMFKLLKFHLFDFDVANDEELMKSNQEISKLLNEKLNSMIEHELYTTYKTGTPEEQEKARKEYLERKGIPSSFRW